MIAGETGFETSSILKAPIGKLWVLSGTDGFQNLSMASGLPNSSYSVLLGCERGLETSVVVKMSEGRLLSFVWLQQVSKPVCDVQCKKIGY